MLVILIYSIKFKTSIQMCTSVDCYHYRCCHKSYKPKNMGTSFKNNFPHFSSLFLKYSDCTLLNANFQEAHAPSFL